MKLDEKMKMMIFSSYNSLIDKNVTRRLMYILILIIEFAQYIAFVLPASSDYFQDNSLILGNIVYYLNVLLVFVTFA